MSTIKELSLRVYLTQETVFDMYSLYREVNKLYKSGFVHNDTIRRKLSDLRKEGKINYVKVKNSLYRRIDNIVHVSNTSSYNQLLEANKVLHEEIERLNKEYAYWFI